jgi:hypothetical protein
MQRERHTTDQQDDKCLGPPTEEAHAGCSELPETKVPEVSVNCLKISSATCCSFGNLQCQCRWSCYVLACYARNHQSHAMTK